MSFLRSPSFRPSVHLLFLLFDSPFFLPFFPSFLSFLQRFTTPRAQRHPRCPPPGRAYSRSRNNLKSAKKEGRKTRRKGGRTGGRKKGQGGANGRAEGRKEGEGRNIIEGIGRM
jgi:hypothetical protein